MRIPDYINLIFHLERFIDKINPEAIIITFHFKDTSDFKMNKITAKNLLKERYNFSKNDFDFSDPNRIVCKKMDSLKSRLNSVLVQKVFALINIVEKISVEALRRIEILLDEIHEKQSAMYLCDDSKKLLAIARIIFHLGIVNNASNDISEDKFYNDFFSFFSLNQKNGDIDLKDLLKDTNAEYCRKLFPDFYHIYRHF